MTVTRQHLLDRLEAVRALWLGLPIDRTEHFFAESAHLTSSWKGETAGRSEIIPALDADFSGRDLEYLSFNNRVARAFESTAVVSSYFHGRVRGASGEEILFGGVLILTLDVAGEQASIADIKAQLTWLEGDKSLLNGWTLPPAKRHWQPEDRPQVIVSELDAPWNRIPRSDLSLTDEEMITEAWFRYAWALDQADFALFEDAFSADAEAELTPMGHMRGRRLLMGTLKAFRMPWPWMQHHGAPISVDIEAEGATAQLVIGRLIPGQIVTPEGEPLYGAHYRIDLVKLDDRDWRINRMNYLPGWLTISPT